MKTTRLSFLKSLFLAPFAGVFAKKVASKGWQINPDWVDAPYEAIWKDGEWVDGTFYPNVTVITLQREEIPPHFHGFYRIQRAKRTYYRKT